MYRRRPAILDALAVDTTVALAVTAATLLAAARPPVNALAVLIALAASVPVRWRRSAIVPVALVTGFATTGLSIVDRMPPLPYGMLVCVYTFATLASTRLRRAAVVLTTLGVAGSLWLTGDSLDTYGFVGMAYAGAYALGAGTRARENQVAMLREQARRLEQDRIAATQRERARIARDMHDVLGHSVTLVAVAAEAGGVAIHTDPRRAEMLFAAIAATAREALGQIRRTVSAMRRDESGSSPDLDPDRAGDWPADAAEPSRRVGGDGLNDVGGLSGFPGLDGLADLVGRAGAAGLNVELVEHGERRHLPPDVAMAVYRITQESLTNTVRHANAGSVQVGLDWTGPTLLVEIRDDGLGGRGGSGGYGLIGMRERAAACGGTLSAGPGDSGGFLVRAELPLAEEATDARDRGGRPGTGPHRLPADPGSRAGHHGGG